MASNPAALDQLGALATRVHDEVAPAVEHFAAALHDALIPAALADGWSDIQAEQLYTFALQPMLQAIADAVPPAQALQQSYQGARHRFLAVLFTETLAETHSRTAAFLSLIALEAQMAARRGEPPPAYPDNLLMAGCQATEAAAAEGATEAQQLETGFAMMRRLVEEGLV